MRIQAVLYCGVLISGVVLALSMPSLAKFALTKGTQIPALGSERLGRVIGVLSGDTVVVETADEGRLRVALWGIEAPDSRQSYGEEAKSSLSELAFGKPVRVSLNSLQGRDRVVGALFIGTLNVGRAQAGRGLAWVTRDGQTDRTLWSAMQSAQTRHAGLWRDTQPVAPWEFRAQQ